MVTATRTIRPTAPAFDRYQFDSKRTLVCTAESQIAFNDYGRMHTYKRARKRFYGSIPDWVTDAARLREVIMRYLEHRHLIAGQRQHLSYEQRMAEVKAAALRELPRHKDRLNMLLECKAADFQIQNCDSKIVLEQKDFASVAASVPYLYYRLGYSSPQVAEQLSLKPPHVRQIIYRMNKIAVAIEEGKVWHRFSGQHRPPPSNECQKTIVQLYKGGMKVAAIARQVGVTSLMARRLLIRAKLIHSQTGWAA